MNRKQIICIAAVIVVALTLFACWARSPLNRFIVRQYWIYRVKAAIPKNKPFDIVPGKSVGLIRLGMSVTEVKMVLGQPSSQLDIAPMVAYNYPTKGISVMLYNGEVGAISCGHGGLNNGELLARAFTGITDTGIRIGSTKQEILNAYGPSVTNMVNSPPLCNNRWHSWAENSNQFYPDGPSILCYPQLGIDFFTRNGTINHIDVYQKLTNLTQKINRTPKG